MRIIARSDPQTPGTPQPIIARHEQRLRSLGPRTCQTASVSVRFIVKGGAVIRAAEEAEVGPVHFDDVWCFDEPGVKFAVAEEFDGGIGRRRHGVRFHALEEDGRGLTDGITVDFVDEVVGSIVVAEAGRVDCATNVERTGEGLVGSGCVGACDVGAGGDAEAVGRAVAGLGDGVGGVVEDELAVVLMRKRLVRVRVGGRCTVCGWGKGGRRTRRITLGPQTLLPSAVTQDGTLGKTLLLSSYVQV